MKPNEFMTLDKRMMESSGQIMYETHTGTMTMGRGNSCSTLSKNGISMTQRYGSQPKHNQGYTDNLDYDTGGPALAGYNIFLLTVLSIHSSIWSCAIYAKDYQGLWVIIVLIIVKINYK